MESASDNSPLIVVIGETASGKSALAMRLAELFNGEIIAADSRTVYRQMDIGTAKPTVDDRRRVPHHLLDVVAPDQPFTVADFKQRAEQAISQICRQGHIPILVGGTGLYIDAILYNFSFTAPPEPAERQRLQNMAVPELQALLKERGLLLPENARNPRHLIRALERGTEQPSHAELRPNTIVVGLTIPRDVLVNKIKQRVDAMVEQGLVEEVRAISSQYGWDAQALQAPGYRAFRQYIDGTITLETAKAQFVHNDLQLAKRQRTWFKRNISIHWVNEQEEAVDLVTTFLNK